MLNEGGFADAGITGDQHGSGKSRGGAGQERAHSGQFLHPPHKDGVKRLPILVHLTSFPQFAPASPESEGASRISKGRIPMCDDGPGRSVETSDSCAREGTIMYATHRALRRTGIAAAALVMAVSMSAGAPALLDAGDAPAQTVQVTNQHCKMTRIGDQLIRCDSLTGTGVAAPSWIPED